MTKTWKKSSRSVRLQVLVSPEDYAAWYNYAAENEIPVKNDSDLVRKLISKVQNIDKLDLDVYILRDRTKQLEKKIEERDEVISRLQSTRIQLEQDLERLKENIKRRRKK